MTSYLLPNCLVLSLILKILDVLMASKGALAAMDIVKKVYTVCW